MRYFLYALISTSFCLINADEPKHNEDDLQKLLSTGKCHKCQLQDIDFRKYKEIIEALNTKLVVESDYKSGIDVQESDLSGTNFDNLSLRNANFSHTNLTDASLRSTYLDHATFDGACLDNTNLSRARLDHATLKQAYGTNTIFSYAYMLMIDLSDATFESPDITEIHVSATTYTDRTHLHNPKGFSWKEHFNCRKARLCKKWCIA